MLNTLTRRVVLAMGPMMAFSSAPLSAQSSTKVPPTRMQHALALLEEAEQVLQSATTDKGGHRKKAIRLTRKAIKETRRGLKYDDLS